jgi:transcription elongation factor Elf1
VNNNSLCIVCKSNEKKFEVPYLHWGWHDTNIFNNRTILTCSICGFSHLLEEPTSEELVEFYKYWYRERFSPVRCDFSVAYNEIDIIPWRSLAQVSLIKTFVEFNYGDIFLDIGPGQGDSFFVAPKYFDGAKLCAVELTEGAENYYKCNFGVSTYPNIAKFLESNSFGAKVILMSHSLEHYRLSDLDSLFLYLKRAINENGILMIEVPLVDMRKHSDCRFPDTPHTLFFSEESLRLLLEKRGFKVIYSEIVGENYPIKSIPVLNRSYFYSLLRRYLRRFWVISAVKKINKIFKKPKKQLESIPFDVFRKSSNGDIIRVLVRLK